MKARLFILLAAFCCTLTTMAKVDYVEDYGSLYDDGFVEVDGIWYRHNMYDEDVDHFYAIVIGPFTLRNYYNEPWPLFLSPQTGMPPSYGKGDYFDVSSVDIFYEGDIVIPSSIFVDGENIPVEGIDNDAFCYTDKDIHYQKSSSVTPPRREPPELEPRYGFPITSITFPNSLLWIGSNAFQSCEQLKSITFGNSLQRIDEFAFSGCKSLTSINIPASVTFLDKNVFSGCSSLESITVASQNPNYHSRNNCNAIIATSQKVLMTGCKNTVIPEDVHTIGYYAFSGCSGLTSINIPSKVGIINSFAFSGCSGLTSISIPGNVSFIGDYAFSHCSGLTSINIPDKVGTICNYTFTGCNSLAYIEIPSSVKNIYSGSFWGCTGLTSIVIPNSVERIGESAFRSCRNLASIVIGSKVSSFGNYAFDYCDNLREVTVLNPTPVSISKWVFPDRAKQILFVPKDSKDAYKAADVWKEFNVVAEIGSSPKVVEGDMNGDGVLTIMDALIIIEKVLGNQ